MEPFFGTMGVCPAGAKEQASMPPGRFGGNIDTRQLVAGTTLEQRALDLDREIEHQSSSRIVLPCLSILRPSLSAFARLTPGRSLSSSAFSSRSRPPTPNESLGLKREARMVRDRMRQNRPA
jgi:hypothetical protein